MKKIQQYLPIFEWLPKYNKIAASKDLVAAVIVTLMLIPQSLAYAMLAGLSPITGLYASILPLVAYAVLGTSKALAVGPVAVISLMTAEAILPLYPANSPEFAGAAMLLALLSGIILVILSEFRLGFFVNFISHPVISGFISASSVLIIVSQIKHILGVFGTSENVMAQLYSLFTSITESNIPTLIIGLSAILLLLFFRLGLKKVLIKTRLNREMISLSVKLGPVVVLLLSIGIVSIFNLHHQGVAVVGKIPSGLPSLHVPSFNFELIKQLLPAAILISVIGFVESVSVAETLANKKQQRIDPNQELTALGGANIASALSGGFPVTGGFSRSVVNYDAGAETPLTGAFTAIGIAFTLLFLTPLFEFLPKAVLAATIIVAVSALIDIKLIVRTFRYSHADSIAMVITILGVLFFNIEVGIISGVLISLLLFLWKTTRPAVTVIGFLPEFNNFRSRAHFDTKYSDTILDLRIDGNIYFGNAHYFEKKILAILQAYPKTEHVILNFSKVSMIDFSGLHVLESLCRELQQHNIQLHLAEVERVLMQKLTHNGFTKMLTGKVFLSHYQAIMALNSAQDMDTK